MQFPRFSLKRVREEEGGEDFFRRKIQLVVTKIQRSLSDLSNRDDLMVFTIGFENEQDSLKDSRINQKSLLSSRLITHNLPVQRNTIPIARISPCSFARVLKLVVNWRRTRGQRVGFGKLVTFFAKVETSKCLVCFRHTRATLLRHVCPVCLFVRCGGAKSFVPERVLDCRQTEGGDRKARYRFDSILTELRSFLCTRVEVEMCAGHSLGTARRHSLGVWLGTVA